MSEPTTTKRDSAEVRERRGKLVQQARGDHPSKWATLGSIASKIGSNHRRLLEPLGHASPVGLERADGDRQLAHDRAA